MKKMMTMTSRTEPSPYNSLERRLFDALKRRKLSVKRKEGTLIRDYPDPTTGEMLGRIGRAYRIIGLDARKVKRPARREAEVSIWPTNMEYPFGVSFVQAEVARASDYAVEMEDFSQLDSRFNLNRLGYLFRVVDKEGEVPIDGYGLEKPRLVMCLPDLTLEGFESVAIGIRAYLKNLL
ncbi:MAG: hypothetical protein WC595_05690 [Candidatus Nanoarchaeia archaeon]